MKIMIDPGHSGTFEPGACAEGVREADINLAVARFLNAELKLRGFETDMTRIKEVFDSELDWRCEKSNNWPADLFISIHCNSAADTAAEGTETYHVAGSDTGKGVAGCVQFCLLDALLTEDRGVKTANFYVLRYTDCPAILVELGFISNAVDRQMLTDPLEQWRAAAAIAGGVQKFFQPEAFTQKKLVVE